MKEKKGRIQGGRWLILVKEKEVTFFSPKLNRQRYWKEGKVGAS